LARDNDLIKGSLKSYDDELEKYIPVLMAQARIYWDKEHYPMVEKLFFQSAEFCSEHEVWKLNVAHVFFMQETKFKDAIRYFENPFSVLFWLILGVDITIQSLNGYKKLCLT
jgi:tetratricopeptide repeat protein 30